MTDLLTRIREKVIEAVPEIGASIPCGHHPCAYSYHVITGRTIHLADVLLAIEWERPLTLGRSIGVNGNEGLFMLNEITGTKTIWNLREDDLEKQAPETQEFIGKLLGEGLTK